MFVVFGAFFAMGVPQAQPGDYGDASPWTAVFFFAGITLYGFLDGYLRWKIRRSGAKPEMHSIEPTATTMPCSWCGRENGLEAAYCKECGTPFPNPGTRLEPLPT